MKKTCVLTCWVVLLAAVAPAQTSSTKSAAAKNSLPSILSLIQEKINAQGEIRYTMISENTIQGSSEEDQYAVETSHAVADPRSCTLQVDAHMSLNGKTQKQGRMGVGFRDITALRVKTQTQAIDERTAKAGVTGWKGRVVPESYIVQTFQGGNLSGIFFFRDEGTANRVAESISQAIRLCGGNVTPVQSK